MNKHYISLDEKPEKGIVLTLMVVFGILCWITALWWAYYLIKNPDQQGSFWAATIFLFLFGAYQVYAGLGNARRFLETDGSLITIRQNSFLPRKQFEAALVDHITIRSMDVIFAYNKTRKHKLKLGIRYPDLGEEIKKVIIDYAGSNKIELFYSYDTTGAKKE